MTLLDSRWEKEVRLSRIVILPTDDSYIQDVGVRIVDLTTQLGKGLPVSELQQLYPSLTEADIRACGLFMYLRAINKL